VSEEKGQEAPEAEAETEAKADAEAETEVKADAEEEVEVPEDEPPPAEPEDAFVAAPGILGRKVGMTQIFSADGNRLPVTIIEAGPCVVVQVKTRERDGYDALQLGFGDVRPKLVSMPRKGHFTAHGVEPTRLLREIRLEEPLPLEIPMTSTSSSASKASQVTMPPGAASGRGSSRRISRSRRVGSTP